MTTRFARALSLSSRLLAAACSTAIASSMMLTLPGCLGRCTEHGNEIVLTREQSPTTATLRGVALYEFEAIAVGDGGVMVVRDESGAWTERASGTTADLHAIAADAIGGQVVAVGAGGTVLRSTDGSAWEAIDTGVAADLRAVHFAGQGVAVAVGDGVILRTDDGGVTWVPGTGPAMPGLRAVASRPIETQASIANEWLAVGDGGLALRSVDDGLTWEAVTLSTSADLRAVNGGSALDGADWVIAAADGAVLRGSLDALEPVTVADPSEPRALTPGGYWMVGADGAVRGVDSYESGGGYSLVADDTEGAALLGIVSDYITLIVGEGGTIILAEVALVETDSRVCAGNPWVSEGRPFVIDDEARTADPVGRDDWCEEVGVAALPAMTRARLADAWTRDGLYEHASVASFARFVLQLLAVGAPPELVLAGQAALADEVRHAQACFGLASAYAGTPVGPGPLAIDGALAGPCDLATLAYATAVEGCVNETIAALVATTAAELAEDPAVRARLTAIAADERRHAALAWRTVAWALGRGDAAVRTAVMQAFAAEPAIDEDASEDGLEVHGRLSWRARAAVVRVAWREIIAPRAGMLLGASRVEGMHVAQA